MIDFSEIFFFKNILLFTNLGMSKIISVHTPVCLINVPHALLNFGPTSTLHDLIWPCTFIYFHTDWKNVQKLINVHGQIRSCRVEVGPKLNKVCRTFIRHTRVLDSKPKHFTFKNMLMFKKSLNSNTVKSEIKAAACIFFRDF